MPLVLAPGTTVPLNDWSVVLAGTTFERSDRAPCQSKRAAAIERTVLDTGLRELRELGELAQTRGLGLLLRHLCFEVGELGRPVEEIVLLVST